MEPYYEDESITLHHGDCLDVLRALPDASVDSVVTDPPYGLEFMGKEWDAPWKADGTVLHDPSEVGGFQDGNGGNPFSRSRVRFGIGAGFQQWCEAWATECLRALKPGGHLLAFGGTRTWHRLACAVEDAGFEIRDSIAWMYGSGFPKSLDVSKAIDKAAPRVGMFDAFAAHFRARRAASGLTQKAIAQHFPSKTGGLTGCVWNWENATNVPTLAQWKILAPMLGLSDEWRPLIERVEAEREVIGSASVPIGHAFAGSTYGGDSSGRVLDITAPATPDAERWQGFGTALKPAFEPVVVARKPLSGTVAGNVLEHGTGALNIDATRIETTDDLNGGAYAEVGGRSESASLRAGGGMNVPGKTVGRDFVQPSGRWPANVILDESQAAALDQMSGESVSKSGGVAGWQDEYVGGTYKPIERTGHDAQGGASRFFYVVREDNESCPNPEPATSAPGVPLDGLAERFRYVAKAPTDERPRVNGIAHPTTKPLTLMRWLVRLVTPPGGTVLEPFAGSGATVEACILEGFRCIAIEREADYLPLIKQRINRRLNPVEAVRGSGGDGGLFDLLEDA